VRPTAASATLNKRRPTSLRVARAVPPAVGVFSVAPRMSVTAPLSTVGDANAKSAVLEPTLIVLLHHVPSPYIQHEQTTQRQYLCH